MHRNYSTALANNNNKFNVVVKLYMNILAWCLESQVPANLSNIEIYHGANNIYHQTEYHKEASDKPQLSQNIANTG